MAIAAVLILLVVWRVGAGAADHGLLAIPVAIGFAGPLAVRRTHPMAALLCSASTALLQSLSQQALIAMPFAPTSRSIMPVLVLLALAYSAGAWLDTGQSVLCIALAWALLLVAAYLPGGGGSGGPANEAQSLLYTGIMIVPGWIAGRLAWGHRTQAETFHDLATSLVADRDRRLSEAVAAERARIGSELQDIIAHAVSVMVVQASGARLILQSDPERARASIIHVERTGREALEDLRRLVGLLRAQADDLNPPAPDTAQRTPVLLDTPTARRVHP